MPDPFADIAEPAPAPAPGPDPFADVARAKTPDEMTPDEFARAYPQTPHQQALNAAAPALQAAPAPTMGERVGGIVKGVAGFPAALLNEGIGQSAAGLGGLGAALTGSKDFLDASNDLSKETSARTSGLEGGLPFGERAAEIGGSVLPMLNPVTAALVPLGMAGQGYVGAINEGATRGQALGKGSIMGTVGAALPGLGRALAPAIAPVGDALANQVSPLAGRVATGLLQGGAAGMVLGGAEAGSTALYNPDLAAERFNDIPSSAGLLAALSGGHAFLGRSPINPAAPVDPIGKPGLDLTPEARASVEKTTDPFADVAVDQTIRPGPDGSNLSAEDVANLRTPEPSPAEPSQEAVAADSTPEADVAHAAAHDPLDAFDPEQIGEFARKDGGQETQVDLSAVEANRRALAERDLAGQETEDLPPVTDPTLQDSIPTEPVSDLRDQLGESGPQETLREPTPAAPESAPVPAELGRAPDVASPEGIPRADMAGSPAGVPTGDVSHLAPDAQAYLRGELTKDPIKGGDFPKVTPDILAHPEMVRQIADRKTSNLAAPDAAGDLRNIAQSVEIVRGKIVREKRAAEKAALQPPKELGQAPGDRVNSDPEHSLKSTDPVARDAEKVLAQDRVKPEAQAQEPLRQEAAKRVKVEGPEAVAKRLVEKHARKEVWTQDEDNEAQLALQHFAKTDGLGQNTRELYEAMNAQNTVGGRKLGNLRDRVQTPVQRHAEANGLASTASAAKAKLLQNLLQERAQETARKTRAAPSEAPAAKALKSASAQAKAKLDAELPKLIEEFKKSLRAPGTNALGGRQAEALYNLLENRVKAGVHSFADLVRGLKKDVPDVTSDKDIQESVEQGWERLRQDNPDMEPGGRVGPELKAQDYAARAKSAEARVAALDKKIEAIRSGIEKDAAELKTYLGKRGYDLSDPNAEWLKDPNRFGDFMAHVDAFKGGIPAVLSNAYIGALHASFGIPAVKAATDLDALAGDAIVRHVEGLVRLATFRPNALKELGAFWSTAPKAASQGLKNAMESTVKERAIGPGSEHEVFGAPSPFTTKMGMAGTVLRHASMLPLVRGINSGAMTYAAMTDAAAWAVRSAKGLKGDELKAHIEGELANQQSDSWRHAIEHAQSLTQTTPLGITNWISRLKHSQDSHVAVRVAARVLAPFITIPTNVALSALRRLPVAGDLAAVARLLDYKEGSVHLHPEKMTHEIARALLRWGLYGVASNYLFGNDEKGKSAVSGYAPQGHDFKGDGVFTHAPHSLTVLGRTVDLNRLGIVGKALSGMKDFHDGKLKEGLIEAGKEEALARPFMDLYYANKFGEAGWGAYVANHFPIPSFMGQLGRAFEDKEKLSYNPTDEGSFWGALADTAKTRAGFTENPDVKLHGESVDKPSFDSTILTRIYRLATPAQLSHSDDFYAAKGKKMVKERSASPAH